MTPTQYNVLLLDTVLRMIAICQEGELDAVEPARKLLAACGITTDAPPPAEPPSPMQCECANWGRDVITDDDLGRHHRNCPHYATQTNPLRQVVLDLIAGMRAWASDEDGVHEDAWPAYVRGCVAVGLPAPKENGGITPAPAEPAKPEPDYRELLKDLTDDLYVNGFAPEHWPETTQSLWAKALAAVAAVRP